VWSVWPESVEIYLGKSVALLKQSRQEAQILRYPSDLSLEQILANMTQEMRRDVLGRRVTKFRRRSLKVTLNAALCPATSFSAPEGVTRWEELRSFAGATAAAGLAVSPEQLICEVDCHGAGVAATVPEQLISQIKRWASQEHLYLESVRPLWATASQCLLMREARIKAMVLHEPDAISLIAVKNDKQAVAITMPISTGAELEPAVIQAHTRRWMMSHGLSQDQLVTLRFGVSAHPPLAQGPKAWANHWAVP
jgi:hypothetical protein